MSISRRQLLRTAAAVAVSPVAARCQALRAASADGGFKIGACEWSLGKSDPSCFALAKQIGLDGVQISMGTAKNEMQLRRADVQQAYLEAARSTGMEIASLAIAELNRVPLKRDPLAARYLAESLDVCKAMGLRVTMPAFFGAGDLVGATAAEMDRVVAAIKGVCPRAEKEGITIALESYLSAADNLRLLDRIGSPAVQVYYDVGNSTDRGYDIDAEIRLLGRRICEFHAKDGKFMLGEGRIDFRKVRAAMDAAGYRGWIQLEAARPNDLVADYRRHQRFLREIFPRG